MIACCPSCGYEEELPDEPCVDCLHDGGDYCDCVVRETCDACALASEVEAEKRSRYV